MSNLSKLFIWVMPKGLARVKRPSGVTLLRGSYAFWDGNFMWSMENMIGACMEDMGVKGFIM